MAVKDQENAELSRENVKEKRYNKICTLFGAVCAAGGTLAGFLQAYKS